MHLGGRAAVASVVVALAVVPAARAENAQIAGLQVALRAYGLYLGPIDGISGPATVQAVREFQRRERLPVDGSADARTRRALGALGGPLLGRRVLRKGMFGWDVSVLQFLLQLRGLPVGALDGYFDGRTRTALRGFQRAAGLTVDGIAGSATFAALAHGREVPLAPLAAAPTSPSARYLVRAGDTLSGLAARFHTTIQGLARANGLDPRGLLLSGTALRVPRVRVVRAAAVSKDAAWVRSRIDLWSRRYQVDPRLARALAWMESGYQTDVVSSSGATGVMQLLPQTWSFVETVVIGHSVDHTPDGNIRVGIANLRHLLDQFHGDRRLALAAWLQGAASVREKGLLPETTAFVEDVTALSRRM